MTVKAKGEIISVILWSAMSGLWTGLEMSILWAWAVLGAGWSRMKDLGWVHVLAQERAGQAVLGSVFSHAGQGSPGFTWRGVFVPFLTDQWDYNLALMCRLSCVPGAKEVQSCSEDVPHLLCFHVPACVCSEMSVMQEGLPYSSVLTAFTADPSNLLLTSHMGTW